MPRLVEFFLIEKTGRDLHGDLDVILDIAQMGGDYESALSRLRHDAMQLYAQGDVKNPWGKAGLDHRLSKVQDVEHGWTGRPSSDAWGPGKSPVHNPSYHRFNLGGAMEYQGSETDSKAQIPIYRNEAHTMLSLAIQENEGSRYGSPTRQALDWFRRVELLVDRLAQLGEG